MRTLLILLFTSIVGFGAQPNPYQFVTGSLAGTTTGVVCTLTNAYATSYTVIIDGETSAGLGTVALQTLSTSNGTYQSITTPAYNALSCTASTLFIESISGPLLGLQANVTAHTSGTIIVTIIAN
jgi:hypothetical protein